MVIINKMEFIKMSVDTEYEVYNNNTILKNIKNMKNDMINDMKNDMKNDMNNEMIKTKKIKFEDNLILV